MTPQLERPPRTVRAPPRRWRNRYWVEEAFETKTGRRYEPGLHLGAYVWPSKEIAEQKGRESVAGREDQVQYLGAEQAPEQ